MAYKNPEDLVKYNREYYQKRYHSDPEFAEKRKAEQRKRYARLRDEKRRKKVCDLYELAHGENPLNALYDYLYGDKQ